jgi:vanillate O-demethylase monooxygenase subunit
LDVARSRLWVLVARNHHIDDQDECLAWNRRFVEFNDEIMEQDRIVVESQRPEGIPLHLREELHIKTPDAAGLSYRSMLREIVGDMEIA